MSDKPFNKQLYENSGLKDLFASLTKDEKEPCITGFFNPREPNLAILHEKPEHRVFIMMKARGWSNREIANATGYTDAWISQLMRQPWAQRTLAEEIARAGRDEIATLLEGSAADSIRRLIDVRDDPETPPAVVSATCERLLDRFLGKPRQQVDVVQKKMADVDDINELDKQIEAVDKELNRLTGKI